MLKNFYQQLIFQARVLKLANTSPQYLFQNGPRRLAFGLDGLNRKPLRGMASSDAKEMKEKLDIEEEKKELIVAKPAEIFQKAFSDYYENGKFVSRISYVEFIDEALARFDELGLSRDLNAYKELLRVFPKGRYHPKKWEIGPVNVPQQQVVIRLLRKMEFNRLRPDKELNRIIISIFTKHSLVAQYIATLNYWTMKGRNIDPNPLPEEIPDNPIEMACVALYRMNSDPLTKVIKAHSSELSDSIDKTWIVYSTSRSQNAILDDLDPKSTLYLEKAGFAFVDSKYLNFFTLKAKVDPEIAKIKAKAREPNPYGVNFNRLRVKFYGAPVEEKLQSIKDQYFVDDGYVLSVGFTGTSSQDSALSWLKIMQQSNPKLNDMKVVFRFPKPIPELLDPNVDPEKKSESEEHGFSGNNRSHNHN